MLVLVLTRSLGRGGGDLAGHQSGPPVTSRMALVVLWCPAGATTVQTPWRLPNTAGVRGPLRGLVRGSTGAEEASREPAGVVLVSNRRGRKQGRGDPPAWLGEEPRRKAVPTTARSSRPPLLGAANATDGTMPGTVGSRASHGLKRPKRRGRGWRGGRGRYYLGRADLGGRWPPSVYLGPAADRGRRWWSWTAQAAAWAVSRAAWAVRSAAASRRMRRSR